MAKACILSEQSPIFESLLVTLPAERFAERPETLIIGMAYNNRSRPDDQKYTARCSDLQTAEPQTANKAFLRPQ